MNKFCDLVFYEIYPTSFMDSNGDGIGDLKGIESKLHYILQLGCNALWINPFYKSPFRDGGYDVEDFFDVDPKFGTIGDFISLVKAAHKKGIKVIIDLVAGHASVNNKDFLKSAEATHNEKSDLFIWTDSVWTNNPNYKLLSGIYPRDGGFMVNFFAHQPAFNYGFKNIDSSWQMSYQDERTFKARNYMIDVMRYWLSLGADGFRVDMADSLVKNDPGQLATVEVWEYLFKVIKNEYPDAYFVAEWSDPALSLKAGFDADFVLDHWSNFYHLMSRSSENTRGVSALNGGNDIKFIADDIRYRFNEAKKYNANIALISGNHDTPRIANSLSFDKLKTFYLFILTMPGTPYIYYGDEIMMKTSELSSKDGGYQRTGTRTPMMWDETLPNYGFSTTNGELYLPFGSENELSVKKALSDKDSLFYFIQKLISLRKEISDLRSDNLEVNESNRVITIKRGENHYLIMNFSTDNYVIDGEVVISSCEINNNVLLPLNSVLVHKK